MIDIELLEKMAEKGDAQAREILSQQQQLNQKFEAYKARKKAELTNTGKQLVQAIASTIPSITQNCFDLDSLYKVRDSADSLIEIAEDLEKDGE